MVKGSLRLDFRSPLNGGKVMDPNVTQLLQGLGFFKDWTNYLLVTTVAALGWIASKPVLVVPPRLLAWTIACFCFSIIFAIFTLALIPIVAENCQGKTTFNL
jgi:hypothetical protein